MPDVLARFIDYAVLHADAIIDEKVGIGSLPRRPHGTLSKLLSDSIIVGMKVIV